MHGRNKRHLLVPRPTSDESTVRGFNLNIVLPAAAVFNIVLQYSPGASPIVRASTTSKLMNLNEKRVQQLALNIVQ
jgi:hypothetical protein